jgi:ATP-dependent helicase HrpA
MYLSYPPELPISLRKDDIVAAVRQNRVLVIAGDTGSGKTTQIPKMCLEAGRGQAGLIGCTQPRRIAAVAVAERVGEELRDAAMVGYKIRFHDRTGPGTRIKFMTDGVLLAETRQDRNLRRYDTIIIDEAHERSLNIDFLLGYLKNLLRQRNDLKLIISSATLDTEKFSAHFGNAPIINVSGRTYPITIEHLAPADNKDDEGETYVELAARMAVRITEEHGGGDMLVFMPTERDIRDCTDLLAQQMGDEALVLPLFGRLHAADQRKIFRPCLRRKIIVATNIAETSLTVPGIRFVIDTGLARISRYNPRARTTSLQVAKVSRASCDQRAGRCGRTGPGYCLRLYGEEEYLGRPLFTQPEIQRANLAEVILQMISLGLGSPRDFPFLDPPAVNSIRDGYALLQELGAITPDNRLTRRGKIMAGLPLDPCISRVIIEAAEMGALREVRIIAAGLSIQDPRIRPADDEQQADAAHRRFADTNSDFMGLLNIWNLFIATSSKVRSRSRMRKFCAGHYLSWQRMREWLDIHDQLTELTRRNRRFRDNTEPAGFDAIHQALLAGFLRNIGQKKEKNTYRISGGREAMLFPGSALFNHGGRWIVCASFMETSRLYAMNAATIDGRWLEKTGAELCHCSWSEPHWEKKAGQVIAYEKVTLFGLVIVAGRKVNYGRINETTAAEAREIFIRQALVEGELGGSYSFLQHNLALIGKFAEMEARTRRRNIIVDDLLLYRFYADRLGPVYDRHTLNQDIRKNRGDRFLRMTDDDICLAVPEAEELYRFPETLQAGSHSLRLTYRFEPGDEADGVTVDIPLSLVEYLNPAVFEWLVPGLLEEKILALLKNLPKTLRRRLVPLPESVERIMDGLQLYRGSLYAALEKEILQSHQIQIGRSQWQPENLPPHLLMRFNLLGNDGRVLLTSRSWSDLLQYLSGTHADAAGPQRRKWKAPVIAGIRAWDFPVPPEPLATDGGPGLPSFLYPTLFVDEAAGCLELRYIEDRGESRQLNRTGLRFMYTRQCSQEVKALAKECKAALSSCSASWIALGLSASALEVSRMLLAFLLDDLFRLHDGKLPSRHYFDETLSSAREKGLVRTGRSMLDHLLRLLVLRREISARLPERSRKNGTASGRDRFDDFRDHLQELLPVDFLTTKTYGDLEHTERYLRALAIRMDRAEHSPAKDSRKAALIQPAVNRLRQFEDTENHSAECCSSLAEYRHMIEEFRVSVFAPELGTVIPVSEKRLRQKWQEVESACLRVE